VPPSGPVPAFRWRRNRHTRRLLAGHLRLERLRNGRFQPPSRPFKRTVRFRIKGIAATQDHGQDVHAPAAGMFFIFHDQHCRSLGQDETVAASIKGTAGRLGSAHAGKIAEIVEHAKSLFAQLFDAAREDRISPSEPYKIGRIRQGIEAGAETVDSVVLKPLMVNRMETWLAGELMTVFGKCDGFTNRGPSIRPERSNCAML